MKPVITFNNITEDFNSDLGLTPERIKQFEENMNDTLAWTRKTEQKGVKTVKVLQRLTSYAENENEFAWLCTQFGAFISKNS